MKKPSLVIALLCLFFTITTHNIDAEETINDSSIQLTEVEKRESDLEAYKPLNKALSVPTEGVYDKTVDTKNASGIMTYRSFYYKDKLVERRYYNHSTALGYRMYQKNFIIVMVRL